MSNMGLRQIDALVAEKVVGWTVKTVGNVLEVLVWPGSNGTTYASKGDKVVVHASGPVLTVPPYSSDRGTAMYVVERMIALEYRVDIRWLLSKQWDVIFDRRPDSRRFSKADPSFALAICIAALRAVGVEVPDYD